MNGSAATITSLVPTESWCVTRSTTRWIEALYEAGAVLFHPDGSAIIDEQVRLLVSALHAVLSGGSVRVEIQNDGGETYKTLEQEFQTALDDSNIANRFRRSTAAIALMP